MRGNPHVRFGGRPDGKGPAQQAPRRPVDPTKNLAHQLKSLPWKQIPVLHSTAERGHGREEIRELQVVSVNGLLFPHARQVVRIRRRSRPLGAKKWTREIVNAVTDLPAEQAAPDEIAAWYSSRTS